MKGLIKKDFVFWIRIDFINELVSRLEASFHSHYPTDDTFNVICILHNLINFPMVKCGLQKEH